MGSQLLISGSQLLSSHHTMAPSTQYHGGNPTTGIAKKSSVHAGKAGRSREERYKAAIDWLPVQALEIEKTRGKLAKMAGLAGQLTALIEKLQGKIEAQGAELNEQGKTIKKLREQNASLQERMADGLVREAQLSIQVLKAGNDRPWDVPAN